MTPETTTDVLEAVVTTDAPAQPDTTALATIPAAELEAISATDQHLAELFSEAKRIAALGVPQTPDEYKLVHGITMVAVRVRTGAEKLAKTVAAPHKAAYDAIIAEGKRIGEKAKEAEALTAPLKAVWDEAEKEREKEIVEQRAAEERAKAARTLQRASALHALGVLSVPGEYVYGEIRIEAIELTTLPDEEWQELYGRVEAAHAEQKRKDEEFAEQLRRELEAEKKRQQDELKRQQDETDRIKAEQEKRQRELAEEAERLAQLRIDTRVERLVGMGATLLVTGEITWNRQTIMFKQALGVTTSDDFEKIVADFAQRKAQHELEITRMANREARLLAQGWQREGPFYSYNNRPDLTVVDIHNATEAEFEVWIAEFEQWKQRQEIETALRFYVARLERMGWESNDEKVWFENYTSVTRDYLRTLTQEQFTDFIDAFEAWEKGEVERIRVEQANAAKEAAAADKAKKRADKERTQRLAKDKNLLHKFALSIGNLAFPEPENDEAKALLTEFNERRVALAEEFIGRIRTL